jgi:hypothetical protein
MIAGVSTVDTMITVFVNLHFKLFTGLYQALSIIHCLLEMHIIVGCAMNQQQLPLQILRQTAYPSKFSFGVRMKRSV